MIEFIKSEDFNFWAVSLCHRAQLIPNRLKIKQDRIDILLILALRENKETCNTPKIRPVRIGMSDMLIR